MKNKNQRLSNSAQTIEMAVEHQDLFSAFTAKSMIMVIKKPLFGEVRSSPASPTTW